MKKTMVLLSGCLLFSLASAQPVYKWVDAKGKVHYGDRPASAKSQKVDTRPRMQGADGQSAKKCPYAK